MVKFILKFAAGVFTCLWLVGCASSKKISSPLSPQAVLKLEIDSLQRYNHHHFGFGLYDPDRDNFIIAHNTSKYFTPASNTKIFTLSAALQFYKDSIPSIAYQIQDDTLKVKGWADATFLHPKFKDFQATFDFLKAHNGPIGIYTGHFNEERFGSGWSWDDYNGRYQAENSSLPVGGNVVTFTKTDSTDFSYFPAQVDLAFIDDGNRIKRSEFSNLFTIPSHFSEEDIHQEKPFLYTDSLLIEILSDTLQKEVVLISEFSAVDTIYQTATDTLYRLFMQESDNFIAEELLLALGQKLNANMNTRATIELLLDSIFVDSPDHLNWRDGSGLSRYNLFTPRSIIWILDQLRSQYGEQYIFDIFPAGGKSGTIASWYDNDPAFVYAKTGTLSNVHCLSGYLRTRNGKTLIFSFMHNNFTMPTSDVKSYMEEILAYIRLNF